MNLFLGSLFYSKNDEKTGYGHVKNWNWTPNLHPQRSIQNELKTWNEIKLLGENFGGKLSNTGLDNDFLDMSLKA